MNKQTPYTVLVVDDNDATLYSTSRVLRNAGFHVMIAATGHEALVAAKQGPDLIVLDVNLPDINGFEICRHLRLNPETSRTPVVYLSATFVSDISKVEGLEAGADGYLTHPVEPMVLIATLRVFLRMRRSEEALRESESRFRAIFDQVLHGICLFSAEFKFIEVNPAMCRILQCSRERLIGRSLEEFAPIEAQATLQSMRDGMDSKGTFEGTFPLRRENGTTVELDWHFSMDSDTDFRLATVVDATPRLTIESEREALLSSERAARATAERANRVKDEFLAMLSHELRTPLGAIVGWAHLLKMGKCGPEDVLEGAEVIERNAKVQTQLIADLLDVSRITSGKMQLEIQLLNPAEIVAAALDSVMSAAHAKRITLQRKLQEPIGLVLADSSRLQQVVWNLVNNAVKFTQSGGRVEVELRRSDSQVEIEVQDNGRGISAEFLPHIFERFRQQDAGTRRDQGGLGLGLAIVKHLVELQGGTVSAASEGENRGSQFTVRLPVAAVGESPLSPSSLAATSGPKVATMLQDVKILVVDDDEDARTMLSRVLREQGAIVHEATSVALALDNVGTWRPHLIISDIGMPQQDGYDLIRLLRANGFESKNLPAIALTAFARGEDRERALQAGFQVHLTKPVDPGELIRQASSLVPEAIRPRP